MKILFRLFYAVGGRASFKTCWQKRYCQQKYLRIHNKQIRGVYFIKNMTTHIKQIKNTIEKLKNIYKKTKNHVYICFFSVLYLGMSHFPFFIRYTPLIFLLYFKFPFTFVHSEIFLLAIFF